MRESARVLQVGLGPVGLMMSRELLRREDCEIVGAVDIDSSKVGRDLGELLEVDELGLTVVADLDAALASTGADLVLFTTTSSLEKIKPPVLTVLGRGLDVLSTCEEMSYPWTAQPELASELDAAAKAAGASVLGTGVNPGFIMDFFPATLSTVCRDVTRVRVERVMDASVRREVFQKKVGAGLDLDVFREAAERGVLRHVGLRESVDMVAQAMGWELERVAESLEPVIAEVTLPQSGIEAGQALGVRQVARGFLGGDERVTLDFQAYVGATKPRERLRIEATPPIDLRIDGGVHGDLATCNVTLNHIPALRRATPGLRTMLDIGHPAGR